MSDQTFRAIIEVVNRATAPIRKIEADIFGLVAPIAAVNAAIGTLARETGITKLGQQASVAMQKVGALGREIGSLLGPVALIGGVASAGGLLEVSKKSSEFGEALVHSSDKTGVDVPVLARLHYVAKIEDVDPEMLDKGLSQLNMRLFKAMRGKDKDLAAMMTHFEGPNWRKRVKTVEDGFGLIADAYNKAKTPFEKAGVVATSFGQKMGQNMVPMLIKGKKALAEMGAEFERFNGVWTRERAERAADAADDWKRLSIAGEGLAMTIGSAVTPSLMKLIVPLTDWIAKNRELVAAKVDKAVKQIGASLQNIDWKGIADGIKSVWGGFKAVADLLGAKGTILLGAAVIFGPIAKAALEAAWALGVLGVQLGIVVTRVAILAGTQVFGFFASLAAGLRLALGPMLAFDLALSTNPIGAIILAVTALAGAAYLIYRNWEPIKKFFVDLWDGIVSKIKGAWDAIKPIVEKVAKAWEKLRGNNTSPADDRGMASDFANGGFPVSRRIVDIHRSLGLARGNNGQVSVVQPERLIGAQGAGGAAASGQVDVNVRLDGLPRGSRTAVDTTGRGINLKVGKSFAHE